MTSLVQEINTTRSARWYAERSAAPGAQGKQAWVTRVEHYERFVDALARRTGAGRINREDVAPTTATLYNRFGAAAKDGLRAMARDGFDLAARVQDPDRKWDVVDNVAVEAKLWSFWPYRTGWLMDLETAGDEDRRMIAEKLVRVVAVWAFDNQGLAGYLDRLPPFAAVEDLCVVMPGEVSPEAAMRFLSAVIRAALDPLGGEPAVVLDTVHDRLMDLGFHRPSYLDELLERAVEAVEEVGYLLSRLDERDRRRVAEVLAPRMSELMRRIDKEEA